MAFEEVCPDRLDLVHKHYRKLCNTLVDIDEWGQVAVLQLLTRYGRTQFVDPNQEGDGEAADQPFYAKEEAEDDESDESESDGDGDEGERGCASW